jgi:gamma-glutamylcyclotransferase (GGCT)/AIG2-like uncharacterized protein YtfP
MSGFNLFVYGTLRRGGEAAGMLRDCEWVGRASVSGYLYDVDGRFPALVLYGEARVNGEVWHCPPALLLRLDDYEGTRRGLFRRVAVEVDVAGETVACWTYAAGPALSRKLVPAARIRDAEWRPRHPAAQS